MRYEKEVFDELGFCGRLLAQSKSEYRREHPSFVPNANVIIGARAPEKAWYGDLDLDLDGLKLQRIADALGVPIYVLPEMAGRFQYENAPQLDAAVMVYTPHQEEQ